MNCLARNNTAECVFLKSEHLSNEVIEKLPNNFFPRLQIHEQQERLLLFIGGNSHDCYSL